MAQILIFDCETIRPVCGRNETPDPTIQYCDGWGDRAGMGVSCIAAYVHGVPRVFLQDNFGAFAQLVNESALVVGWNNNTFDNKLLADCGICTIPSEKSYDLLRVFQKRTGKMLKLDTVCRETFGVGKTGDGGDAPRQWQRGELGRVIDYCLHDVLMTKMVFDHAYKERPFRARQDGPEFTVESPIDRLAEVLQAVENSAVL